jgi:hypothetical protein
MYAVPEGFRQIVHQHALDDQQGVRLLLEVEVQRRPLAAVDARRLDGEVDVGALELVAAGPRAEQPDPLDRRVLGELCGQRLDHRPAGEILG